MEQQIKIETFRNIVTNHPVFDNKLSLDQTLLVKGSILKTAENYTNDGYLSFDFESIEKVYKSDYYSDYDGELYKNKKPPFVSALMENLMKDPNGLTLALYYVEIVTNSIMNDALLNSEEALKSKNDLIKNKIDAVRQNNQMDNITSPKPTLP